MTPNRTMMRPLKMILFVLILFAGLAGCRLEDETADENPPFQFLVVSDIHVRIPGNPDDYFYDNQENLNMIQQMIDLINGQYSDTDFVAVTGDLVGCLFSEDPDDYLAGSETPPEKFKLMFDGLIPPYHVALGNHDYHIGFDRDLGEQITALDIQGVESVWKKVLEIEPYYAFVHKGIQMIFLNSNRGPARLEICPGLQREALCKGSFDEEQMDWLESRLNGSEPAILFCHHPPQKDLVDLSSVLFREYFIDPDDRFYEIAEQYKHKILAMFVGHWHLWQDYTLFDTIEVHQTGPIGDGLGWAKNISIVQVIRA